MSETAIKILRLMNRERVRPLSFENIGPLASVNRESVVQMQQFQPEMIFLGREDLAELHINREVNVSRLSGESFCELPIVRVERKNFLYVAGDWGDKV